MIAIDFGRALRSAGESDPGSIPAILTSAAAALEPTDLVVYLVDFGQTILEPLPDGAAHAAVPVSEPVAGSMAGKAFTDQEVVTAERDAGVRVWIPVVEGSDRTGIVALTLAETDDARLQACTELGLLAGYLIAAKARCTDLYNLYRRRRAMSLAASMQWDLLPPLVMRTDRVAVAGVVEPAYDVGGDCFDYAANGTVFDVAIMDAMGHGLGSAVIAALAMGCYRHDRRESRSLTSMHTNLAAVIEGEYRDRSFATGLLARIDTSTGTLTWTNAGHPLPLLIRGGSVVGPLRCPPTPPWGAGNRAPTVASEQLEPGDCLLLYTDGVTEARNADGEELGLERLVDLTDRNASHLLRPEDIVRLLVQGVREHQGGDPTDDATVVMVRWAGPRPQ